MHEREKFFEDRSLFASGNSNICNVLDSAFSIENWAKHCSFYTCSVCNSIVFVQMPHNFAQKKVSERTKCHCHTRRYIVSQINQIPIVFQNLSIQNVITLRPFDLDCGVYKRKQHGYRVKTGIIKLTVSPNSVMQRIRQLTNDDDMQRCKQAYQYLMTAENSHYSHFVNLREELVQANDNIITFDYISTSGIECALWPNLYPFSSWCESIISGESSGLSMKKSFCSKLFSLILDYGLNFELLQWQYDRSMYKVVRGAINTACVSSCSPARALDCKPFSPTYWQWKHRYLLDAVSQFGFPDIFLTISPLEWSFPFPDWVTPIHRNT